MYSDSVALLIEIKMIFIKAITTKTQYMLYTFFVIDGRLLKYENLKASANKSCNIPKKNWAIIPVVTPM